ncbi:MAG: YceD family protein [Pseudohongiella sp.]|nr:YceD family protein [Pseudohongiella sp.]
MAETPNPQSVFPPQLDPRKVFRQALQIQGHIAVSALDRLCEILLDDQGVVNARLAFEVDSDRRLRIRGHVNAEVSVVCQRCMQPMKQILDDSIDLVMVSTEARMKQLPATLDPWFCGEDEVLVPADIIEEQLILAMPIVTMHQSCIDIDDLNSKAKELHTKGSSGTESSEAGSGKHNPFAVLAGLKSDRNKS